VIVYNRYSVALLLTDLLLLSQIYNHIETVVFRKRISAKTTVFSVLKSVKLVGKSDDTLSARRRRALV
jgi:hypothetical protein